MDVEKVLPLLKKYDQRGPRYTSYPATPYFQSDFSINDWHASLKRLQGRPLSLYFHIPYCRSLCWYCGCHMQVNRRPQVMAAYLHHLKQEFLQTLACIPSPGTVEQIHFGGGSPNLLEPNQLADLMTLVRQSFTISADAEISLEADPRLLTEDFIWTMREQGFNRVSMGIQSFDPDVQLAINRNQPFSLVSHKVTMLREAGFDAINMDLMYGLPLQTESSFFKTLQQVCQLNPQRIAVFNYAYLPQFKPHMKLIDAAAIPSANTKFRLFCLARNIFTAHGYRHIGMDHFARSDDSLALAANSGDLHRNFQGYTTHADLQMLGFGSSAISFLEDSYIQNTPRIKQYGDLLDQKCSPLYRGMSLKCDDHFRANIIQRLFCQNTIHIADIEAAGNASFDHLFPHARKQLAQMTADGLLIETAKGWQATDLGQILLRNIAMIFDAYLEKGKSEKAPTFSKTL